VEADHSRLQLRAVQLLGFAFGAQEECGRVQFIKVKGFRQLERLLLEVVVDFILVVANLDLAWRGQ
jgi:hypothetical protein